MLRALLVKGDREGELLIPNSIFKQRGLVERPLLLACIRRGVVLENELILDTTTYPMSPVPHYLPAGATIKSKVGAMVDNIAVYCPIRD